MDVVACLSRDSKIGPVRFRVNHKVSTMSDGTRKQKFSKIKDKMWKNEQRVCRGSIWYNQLASMNEHAQTSAIFASDHKILVDLHCNNILLGVGRKIQMEIRLPRSTQAKPCSVAFSSGNVWGILWRKWCRQPGTRLTASISRHCIECLFRCVTLCISRQACKPTLCVWTSGFCCSWPKYRLHPVMFLCWTQCPKTLWRYSKKLWSCTWIVWYCLQSSIWCAILKTCRCWRSIEIEVFGKHGGACHCKAGGATTKTGLAVVADNTVPGKLDTRKYIATVDCESHCPHLTLHRE